jgi:predicted ATP-grasp superfamily ATP-dependent carboligase
MRVLVTGARLPAALEIARALSRQGHEVYTADTVRFGFAVRSRAVQNYFRVPSPAHRFPEFRVAILGILLKKKIDLVIPVSEEIFFLAKFAGEMPCRLLAPPFEILRTLHSKIEFQSLFPAAPSTKLVHNRAELELTAREFGEIVLKKEFSRGAIGTRIRPTSLEGISFPILVQKYLAGSEVCTYSIAHEGKLLAHVAYEPRYRFGAGASVYFRSVTDEQSHALVQHFVSRTKYTGQVAFDFIQTDNGPVALECNPRATSGVHLLTPGQIANAVLGTSNERAVSPAGISRSALLTLLLTNLVSPTDLFKARDTSFSWRDPLPFLSQFASGAELAYRAWRWNMKAGDAFGYDLEWNGEPFE